MLSGLIDILNTGYSPLENPFSSVIFESYASLNDVLLGSGDVTFRYISFDLDIKINSRGDFLPPGLIKNFVSLVSNGFMSIYKYGLNFI